MSGRQKIRVLIVDDNPVFRLALSIALGGDPDIEVVGKAADGKEAVELTPKVHPDVITMDVLMPVLDGIEASKQILEHHPIPILLMSTLARSDEQRMALNAMRLGVMDVMNKPVLAGPSGPEGVAQVIRLVKAAAEAEVVVRPRSGRYHVATGEVRKRPKVIVVGASTGGPPALERILHALPRMFPPIVVAQHLAPSFTRGFAEWLAASTARPVVPVAVPEPLRPGTVYIAAENRHVRVQPGFADGLLAPDEMLAPSADVLFRSAAESYGPAALGIVLTGMGGDGAEGLKALRAAGAWTIGQDRDSSAVYGMPRSAAEAGACCEVLSLDEIASRLLSVVLVPDENTGGRP
jgi:two-component system chemotaxis response regulator CheB